MENPISRTPFTHIQTGFSRENFARKKSSPPPFLEFGNFEVPLTKLDHSPQTFKATIAKSALSNRRPPSRSSRASSRKSSSAESFSQANEFAGFDVIEPKVVNILVHIEDETANDTDPNINQSQRDKCDSVIDSPINYYQKPNFRLTPVHTEKTSRDIGSILKSVSSLLKSGPSNFKSHSPPQNFSPVFTNKEEYHDNVGSSSSETEVIISDKESIADSGIVNRRTVIKINEKSKSSTSINESVKLPIFNGGLKSIKDFDTCSLSPSLPNINFSGGINVSITSQRDNTKDSKSRMYVRQSDSENRSTRASAFNVRRTIEKRQLQQERSQRKALRDQIREKLRNFTETRQRKESISSNTSSEYSTASNRSKSLTSLHEDQEHLKAERPIFKVQSSPTLDSEKNELRTYLFGSNLDDPVTVKSAKLVANIMPSASFIYSDTNELKQSGLTTHNFNSVTDTSLPSKNYSQFAQIKLHSSPNTSELSSNLPSNYKEDLSPGTSPVVPPRRLSRVSRSAGQLTVEKGERPAWLRLAKERRSLRSQKTDNWDQFSDTASSVATAEPEWVAKARKKLESMNICLTSTTDIGSINSQVTESSSAWSRGGLDALEDLRDEVSRISEQLADEATERVVQELGIENRGINMLEFHKNPKSRESSSERQRVSFDESTKKEEKPSRSSPTHKIVRDEIKFGDLKHDWGGVQSQLPRTRKVKETRFGEVKIKESNEGKHIVEKIEGTKRRESYTKPINFNSTEQKPIIHFGDNPSDIFTKKTAPLVKSQSSSKFESIAGPDPTNMTAEQLNQNVEEYDFPIPTGNEDTEELLTFLRDSLNKEEPVPVIVSTESPKLKPKSILKKSTENIQLETKDDATEDTSFRKNSSGGKIPCTKLPEQLSSCFNHAVHDISSRPIHSSNGRDDPIKPVNSTNTINSITNAAGSFFNVKLRHVDSKPNNKCLEAEDCEQYKSKKSDSHKERRHTDCGIQFTSLKSSILNREPSNFKSEWKNKNEVSKISLTEFQDSNKDTWKMNLKNNALSNHEKVVSVLRLTNGLVPNNKSTKSSKEIFQHSCDRKSQMTSSVQKQSWHFCRAGKIEQSKIKSLQENSQSEGGLKKSLSFSLKPSNEYESKLELQTSSDSESESEISHLKSESESEIPHLDSESESEIPHIVKVAAPRRPSRQSDRFASSISIQSSSGGCVKENTNIIVPFLSSSSNDQFHRKNIRDSKLYSSLRDSTSGNKNKRIAVQEHQETYSKTAEKHRRSLPTTLDKHKGKNFLFEWEMVQRKKLEDEDNIQKQNALKPVSTKIKDIVKLHSVSTLRSIFLKDKKGEYNGTVDGTEDIFFQKIPDNSETPTTKIHSTSMKSPSIVQKISQINNTGLIKQRGAGKLNEGRSNYERQTYSFNHRNIYTSDELPPLNKIQQSHIEPKLYSSNTEVKNVESNYEKKSPRAPDRRKDWVNNMLNSLPTDTKEEYKKRSKLQDERGSAYRRSFHEYLPRKDKELKPFVHQDQRLPKESRNETIFGFSFTEKDQLNDKNEKNKSLSQVSALLAEESSKSAYRSAMLDSKLNQTNNENKENENIYPTKENKVMADETIAKENIGKYERIKSIRERINAINHTGRPVKSYLERKTSPTREVRTFIQPSNGSQRPLSPETFSDSVFGKSRETSPYSRLHREMSPSNRSTSSILSTIENESRPVSLSSILERDVSSPVTSKTRRGSASELYELTKKYRKGRERSSDIDGTKFSSDIQYLDKKMESNNNDNVRVSYSSNLSKNNIKPEQIVSRRSPSRGTKKKIKESRIYNSKSQSDRERNNPTKRDTNMLIKHTSLGEFSKPSSKIVKRKSSLKKIRPKDIVQKRYNLEEDLRNYDKQKRDSDANSEMYESIRRTPGGGWTKTSVRKTRLGSGSSERSLNKKGKNPRDKNFRTEASNVLENWAAGTKIQGKLLKKEGQKYSHEVEEMEKEGKKSTKAVARRIVRRGSRRLSRGGEFVSETKEVASAGDPTSNLNKNCDDALVQYTQGKSNGLNRKMKSSTDGERYVTQSVHTQGGIQKTTTTGVDNKTIKSQEIIGGRGWEGKRQVSNSLGEKLTVEKSVGPTCRPSTVVKKATTQSKFVITKTKMKVPIM